jgi:hypothetical protein
MSSSDFKNNDLEEEFAIYEKSIEEESISNATEEENVLNVIEEENIFDINEEENFLKETNIQITSNSVAENETQIEVVVARYNESLNWTTEYPFNQFNYTVYNKGINDYFVKTHVNKIINLPNVGRCDHTYLHHIVRNYDTKSLAKVTIFLPGSINMAHKKPIANRMMMYILKTKKAAFFAQHSENIRNEFAGVTMDSYVCKNPYNRAINPEVKCLPALIRPYSSWYDHHFGDRLVKSYAYYGILSIDKKDVMQYKKEWFIKFLYGLARHSNPEAGHFTERSWAAIFYPMKHTLIMKKC